jgi:hypothetical protein
VPSFQLLEPLDNHFLFDTTYKVNVGDLLYSYPLYPVSLNLKWSQFDGFAHRIVPQHKLGQE